MAISSAQGSGGSTRLAASLLFHPGQRPDAAAIVAHSQDRRTFAVTLDPHDGEAGDHPGWLELLASGLTFDLLGLSPAPGEPVPEPRQILSLGNVAESALEAITLAPGPHLAGSTGILPVARTLAWLAAMLTHVDGVQAICWHPARCWCAPGVFRDAVDRWVEGGVFPGLMLTSIAPSPDGGLQSEGLAALTGQELRLEPELAADRAEGTKLALRLLDFLIVHGKVTGSDRMIGPDGNPLRFEPSVSGRFVRVWRG